MPARSYGAYASPPGSPADGDIFIPTDSYYDYLRWESAAGVWRHHLAGRPVKLPVDGDFTWINQGSATTAQPAGAIVFRCPASTPSVNTRARVAAAPSSPWSVESVFTIVQIPDEFVGAGLLFYESSSDRSVFFGVSAQGNLRVISKDELTNPSSPETGLVTWPVESLAGANYLWWSVALSGGTLNFEISGDGRNKVRSYSAAVAGLFDDLPDQIGYRIDAPDAAFDSVMTILHWDLRGIATAAASRHISDYLSSGVRAAKRAIY